jgi:putative ABC transport system permease protein
MLKLISHAKEALLNLHFSKLRSSLALLGVLVGTASVVAMALKQFKSLGTDLLAVSVNTAMDDGHSSSGKEDNLSLDQTQNLLQDKNVLEVAPYTQLFYPMFYNGVAVNGMILGVTQSFANIVHINMQSGRFISNLDQYNFYCVIGQDIYKALKKISYRDPIGQQLQIGKYYFVIVGVAKAWPENEFVYANVDTSIMMPLMASTVISKYATINNIIVRLKPNTDINAAKAQLTKRINAMVSNKHLEFRSAKELIAKMRKQSDILTVFLGLIGSVSLLVGGIGVMNIMLVSVMERRREIGIRLAVGAKRMDIAALFLVEAIILSLIGGLLGVLIGILIAYVIALIWHWEFTLYLWPPLAGFSVSVAVGIFFGFYPAYLASKLDPIDALRSE